MKNKLRLLSEITENDLETHGLNDYLKDNDNPATYPFVNIMDDNWRIAFPLIDENNKRFEIDKQMMSYLNQLRHMGYRINLDDDFGYAFEEGQYKDKNTGQMFKQSRRMSLGKLFPKLGKEANDFWQKHNGFYTAPTNLKYFSEAVTENYWIILSRHPIDILRMSDTEHLKSCHSREKDLFYCAVDESKCGSLIAYLITENDYNIVKDKLNSNEIFFDKERHPKKDNLNKIEAEARLRTRFVGVRDLKTLNVYSIAVPERRVYGDNRVSIIDYFRNSLSKFLFDKQKDVVQKLSADAKDEKNVLKRFKSYLAGGSHLDNSIFSLFKEFIELNDPQISLDERLNLLNIFNSTQHDPDALFVGGEERIKKLLPRILKRKLDSEYTNFKFSLVKKIDDKYDLYNLEISVNIFDTDLGSKFENLHLFPKENLNKMFESVFYSLIPLDYRDFFVSFIFNKDKSELKFRFAINISIENYEYIFDVIKSFSIKLASKLDHDDLYDLFGYTNHFDNKIYNLERKGLIDGVDFESNSGFIELKMPPDSFDYEGDSSSNEETLTSFVKFLMNSFENKYKDDFHDLKGINLEELFFTEMSKVFNDLKRKYYTFLINKFLSNSSDIIKFNSGIDSEINFTDYNSLIISNGSVWFGLTERQIENLISINKEYNKIVNRVDSNYEQEFNKLFLSEEFITYLHTFLFKNNYIDFDDVLYHYFEVVTKALSMRVKNEK